MVLPMCVFQILVHAFAFLLVAPFLLFRRPANQPAPFAAEHLPGHPHEVRVVFTKVFAHCLQDDQEVERLILSLFDRTFQVAIVA